MIVTARGTLFIFSHRNNYGINPTFQCDSLANLFVTVKFDVLGSLEKNLTLLANKIALSIITPYCYIRFCPVIEQVYMQSSIPVLTRLRSQVKSSLYPP